MVKYTIVIPCYRSSDTIKDVVKLTSYELKDEEIDFVLVNDGSPDNGLTAKAIIELASEYENVTAIDLAKNTGQHNAILCGLNSADGEYIICMDDDMQTHPSQIRKLIKKIEEGYDVVYAKYPKKKHTLFRRMGSFFNSTCEKLFLGKPRELETNSYWIMRKFIRDYLIEYKNSFTYLDGLVLRTTSNIANVEVEHFERTIGTSGYTFIKLLKHWFDIIGFTVAPLKFALFIGAITSVGSIASAIVLVIRKLAFGIQTTGWTSLMVAMCFLAGIILMFMGFIGEYIGRVFMAANSQPQYVIREIYSKNKNDILKK